MKKLTYLSLGSNIGDRERNLRAAIERLGAPGLRVLRVSPVYETEPVDYTDQRWFYNLVVEAETTLFPMQLLARAQKVERVLGRVRTVPKGPRIIDIDILLYADTVMKTKDLEIPHSSMGDRQFVLVPMAEIAPDVVHPVTKKTIREMNQSIKEVQGVMKLNGK